ncbi:MAG TPA: hypothetical protein VFK04_21695 [Gemmatimonadaceae bacterium]|nr:hypothetical protein [Gemmatimonadaceae bacterium]
MYRSIAVAAAAIATLACVAGRSAAQSINAAAGYVALTLTPTGGLTPVVRPWMAGIPQSEIGIDARWGSVKAGDTQMNTIVAGVSIPASGGRGDVTFSGGYLTADCEDCKGNFVASLAAERGLFRRVLDERGTQLGLGINTSLGFAKPEGGSLWSATLGTPIYVGFRRPGETQIVPFVIPSLGWGLVLPDEGDSESGVRFTAGGGVGIVNVAPGLNLHLGVQKTFIRGGKTVFGAGLTYMIPR